MLSQYGILFHIETTRRNPCYQRLRNRYLSQTCFILGHSTKITLSDPSILRTARIPRTTLTNEVITGLDITILPIGTVLA